METEINISPSGSVDSSTDRFHQRLYNVSNVSLTLAAGAFMVDVFRDTEQFSTSGSALAVLGILGLAVTVVASFRGVNVVTD